MTEQAPPSQIGERILQRLRKLAEGNGLAPEDFQLYAVEEKVYALDGVMTFLPLFEAASARYPGEPRNANAKSVAGRAAMQPELDRIKQSFESGEKWISEAINQVKTQPTQGWGLDNVRVPLPDQSVSVVATETCSTCQGNKSMTCEQCQGQGSIVCPQCQGHRQEFCHICAGRGVNPAHQDQQCLNCHGQRYVPCRFCQGQGQLSCPTCHGRRGTVCSACNGAGQFTEETIVTCGARTQFHIKGEDLPSGLRRGLSRLGYAKLAQGHADIELGAAPSDGGEEGSIPDMLPPMPGTKDEPKKEKLKPELHYIARLPYADLRMGFPGKKAIVGVFGKKNVLLGVPPFLDRALEPARDRLKAAAKGTGKIDEALKDARVLRDALKLQLAGIKDVNALRRLYPLGLSPQAAGEILANMRLALNRLTLTARSLAAAFCVFIGSGIFASIFLTPLHGQITGGWKQAAGFIFDLALLFAVLAACWCALSTTTRFALQKRFPGFNIPLTQKTGKTGYTMLSAIIAVFAVILALAPVKPEWLQRLF